VFSATALSKELGVSQPSASISVKRGEKIAKAGAVEACRGVESYNFMDVPQFQELSHNHQLAYHHIDTFIYYVDK
jgi:hypothetical protein